MSAALGESMAHEAIRHPILRDESETQDLLMQFQKYRPQLNECIAAGQTFGADFVDSTLPVKHLGTRWDPPTEMHVAASVQVCVNRNVFVSQL